MSKQPSTLPNRQSTQVVQAGLTVRTAIRAGEGSLMDNIDQTIQEWWLSLLNGLPAGQASAAETATDETSS